MLIKFYILEKVIWIKFNIYLIFNLGLDLITLKISELKILVKWLIMILLQGFKKTRQKMKERNRFFSFNYNLEIQHLVNIIPVLFFKHSIYCLNKKMHQAKKNLILVKNKDLEIRINKS